jgi:hypothetical protein
MRVSGQGFGRSRGAQHIDCVWFCFESNCFRFADVCVQKEGITQYALRGLYLSKRPKRAHITRSVVFLGDWTDTDMRRGAGDFERRREKDHDDCLLEF